MITLIHGDDKTKVHDKLVSLLDKNTPKIEIDLKNDNLEYISDTLKSDSLFTEKKLLILQNFKSLHHTKRKKLYEIIVPYKSDKFTHIIIFSEYTLQKKIASQIPTDNTFTFDLPKYFFTYLDTLTPGNSKKARDLLTKLSKENAEQLFYATVNRIRLLLLLKTNDREKFPDLKKMSPYYKSRLQTQSGKWREENLIKFYADLFEIEKGLKTSNLPLGTQKTLELKILKHLS